MTSRGVWRLIKETIKEWNEDNVGQMAAALAYYTIFSIAPLLVIAVAVAGAVFGEDAAKGELVRQIDGVVGKSGAEVIQTALANTKEPGSGSGLVATLVSLGFLMFGASGVFVQLQDSLNAVWNVKEDPNRGVKGVVRKRILSFAMVVTIGFILMASLVVSAGLAALNAYANNLLPGLGFLWKIVNLAVSFGAIAGLFALVYKYLPDITIAWRDVLVGASLASVLFAIGKEILGYYLANNTVASTYGAAGSLVSFLTWIYYTVQILLLGGEFTQVYARMYGSHKGGKDYTTHRSVKRDSNK